MARTAVRPLCAPTGPLLEPALCRHERQCACGEPLHLGAAFEVPGVHSWVFVGRDGSQVERTWPWGASPTPPVGWWEALAACDIATYSVLSARDGLGMLASTHRHDAMQPCPLCTRRPEGPWCCGMPMFGAVEGWRCRVGLLLVPYAGPAAL